jgi:hypothetical protein
MMGVSNKNLTNASCRTWVNCHLFRAARQKSRQFTQAANAGVKSAPGTNFTIRLNARLSG